MKLIRSPWNEQLRRGLLRLVVSSEKAGAPEAKAFWVNEDGYGTNRKEGMWKHLKARKVERGAGLSGDVLLHDGVYLLGQVQLMNWSFPRRKGSLESRRP
eukprot:Hpha_TRINITY_DN20088_c0_g1::TRINITY_DN20088_c0_g1_i1::g.147691::m.147691